MAEGLLGRVHRAHKVGEEGISRWHRRLGVGDRSDILRRARHGPVVGRSWCLYRIDGERRGFRSRGSLSGRWRCHSSQSEKDAGESDLVKSKCKDPQVALQLLFKAVRLILQRRVGHERARNLRFNAIARHAGSISISSVPVSRQISQCI